MNPKSFRIAMLYLSQKLEVPEQESPILNPESEKLTLSQRKSIIEKSLTSYYSPVINAYLRQYDDLGHLMLASQYAVSLFGDNTIPSFHSKLGNLKIKILNTVGEIALDSLKDKFAKDSSTNKMSAEELDSFVRSELGNIRRDTLIKTKKIQNLLNS